MYQTDFICTYKYFSQEDPHASDLLYKIQFLQAFDLKEWKSTTIAEICYDLYEKIKDLPEFKEIIVLSPFYEEKEESIAFQGLFSYDTFDLLHLWLIKFIKNSEVCPTAHANLLKELNNKS